MRDVTAPADRPKPGPPIIALDAMGGDNAPNSVVLGAEIASHRHPEARFVLVGDEAKIEAVLSRRKQRDHIAEIRHAATVVGGDDKPSTALRSGRQSSMRLAIDAVAQGDAQSVVSAGNTGALMAMAKFVFKTMPGIDRPAIASFFPTKRGESVMLDLGANVDCGPENLVQFAIMGSLFGKAVLGFLEPTVGILNIGSEALKGNDAVKEAANRLRAMENLPGRFTGFVEGDEVTAGAADVVVTDGFTGNVALKATEGAARLYSEWLRQTFHSSIWARIGYLLARGAFLKLRARTDPRRYNGAMFLGLNGICVKSHGGTDARGFAHAIDVAVDLVRHGFNDTVRAEFEHLTAAKRPAPVAVEAAG